MLKNKGIKQKKERPAATDLINNIKIITSVGLPDGGTEFSVPGARVKLEKPDEKGKIKASFNFSKMPENKNEINAAVRASIEQKGGGLQKISTIEIIIDGDAEKVKSQLKQMVTDMNQEAIKTGQAEYAVKLLPPAEGTKGKKMQFQVVPLEEVISLMSVKDLEKTLGKPKGTSTSPYSAMHTALANYETSNNLLKLSENNDTPQNIAQGFAEYQTLLNAAKAYEQSLDQDKNEKEKDAVRRLIQQIGYSHPLHKFNAADAATAEEGGLLGHGSKGPVYAKIFPDGFEAAVKMDSTDTTEPAMAAGIAQGNPQESRRAVTAYAVDKLLGLGAIPETRFVTQRDENGAMKLGSAMAVVHGFVGQRMYRHRELSPTDIQRIVKDGNIVYKKGEPIRTNDQYEVVLDKNEPPSILKMYKLEPRVVNVPYESGKLQKGLSNLQLFDNIIGAADRHPGNWIYISDGPNAEITTVQGIDNDDAHGKEWVSKTQPVGVQSKTPPVPPVVDVETAIKVLQTDEKALQARLHLLPTADAEAEMKRFKAVKAEVMNRVNQAMLASDDGKITLAQVKILQEAGAQILLIPTEIYQWGTEQVKQVHTEKNSYLGEVLARKRIQNTTDAEFK